MKVLVVSYYSLWSSSVGGRRANGIVRALLERGDEVALVSAAPANGLRADLPQGVHLIETPACDRVLTARRLVGRLRRRAGDADAPAATAPARASAPASRRSIAGAVRPWVSFPDTMWEWHHAVRRAVAHDGFVPDVVVATAPPMAALRAAAGLARTHGCTWVADMRDLWTGDPYRPVPRPLRRLDRRLERRTLGSAAAITTVAEVMTDELRAVASGVPVTAIRNGFDPAWLRHGHASPDAPPAIVFTGTLTSNTGRDLEPLLAALAHLAGRGGLAAELVVDLYGAADPALVTVTTSDPRSERLRFRGVIGGADARRVQHGAAALLSFGWDDPREFHKLPAKLFEYAAARRPIIHIGRVDSLGVRLIAEHGLGVTVSPDDPAQIADAMQRFAEGASWRPPAPDDLAPLSQRSMVDRFLQVLDGVSGPRGDRSP